MPIRKTKPRKPTASEREVTRAVLDAARLFGLKLERQNVGMAFGAGGNAVRFGQPGDPDWRCDSIPTGPNRGRSLWLEIKREGFDPRKLKGLKRKHFDNQLARMCELNAGGSLALWVSDARELITFCGYIRDYEGLSVVFVDGGFPQPTALMKVQP